MKKRHKKKKRRPPVLLLFIVLVSGYLGWYFFESLDGISSTVVGGLLFYIVLKIWLKTRKGARLRKAGIKQIDQMTGEEFEHFLGELFKKRGFKVSFTKASGDFGADLILRDGDELIAVQAKRYSGNVGVKAVQEVIGAIKMYEAEEAWVVTNSYFTKQAIKLAEINDIYLIDRDELIDMILGKA